MSEIRRIECPARLLEQLKPLQEQIARLNLEINAALFGARIVLNVPDNWQWDMSGWREPISDDAGLVQSMENDPHE